ncbi:hypothetical protein [Paracoccus sp. SSK6]|uniref:hypothetical protein n=1 Tax=Paracoccus sp. SSK6 TaxID=3143131 RepID=UPI00321B16E9
MQSGRYEVRQYVYQAVGEITRLASLKDLSAELNDLKIPNAAINDIRQAHALPAIRSKMTKLDLPNEKTLRMQPRAVDLPGKPQEFQLPRPLAPTPCNCFPRSDSIQGK